LAVNAADDGLISQVEFFDGDRSLGVVRASPFVLTVPLSPASYSLVAKASDDNGSVTSSEAVNFEVSSNHRPAISLTSPAADTHIIHPNPVTLKVQIADEEESLAKVEYFNVPSQNQVTSVGTVYSAPFELPAAPIDFGVARIIAVVTDTGGLSSTSAPVRFFFSDRLRLTHVRDQPGWFTYRTSPTFSTIIIQISTDLNGTNWVDQGTGNYTGGGMLQSAVPLSGSRMFIRAKVK
jgi:chitinase